MTITNILLFCILLALAPALAEVLGMIALGLVGLAALAIGACFLVASPEIAAQIGGGILGFLAIVGFVAVLAVINKKIAARLNPPGAEWTMLGVVASAPLVLAGFLYAVASALDGHYALIAVAAIISVALAILLWRTDRAVRVSAAPT